MSHLKKRWVPTGNPPGRPPKIKGLSQEQRRKNRCNQQQSMYHASVGDITICPFTIMYLSHRRLADNRKAARRAYQKKKVCLSDLEKTNMVLQTTMTQRKHIMRRLEDTIRSLGVNPELALSLLELPTEVVKNMASRSESRRHTGGPFAERTSSISPIQKFAPGQLTDLVSCFDKYDGDSDGLLLPHELRQLLDYYYPEQYNRWATYCEELGLDGRQPMGFRNFVKLIEMAQHGLSSLRLTPTGRAASAASAASDYDR